MLNSAYCCKKVVEKTFQNPFNNVKEVARLLVSGISSDCQVVQKLVRENKKQSIRRSLLYIPGHDVKKINKLSQLNVDCSILDCEDGVSFDKKEAARSTILELCEKASSMSRGEVGVRVNPPSGELAHNDLTSIFGSTFVPSCVVLPKINHPHELKWACDLLQETLLQSTSRVVVNIIFMVESALGLVNMKEVILSGLAACSKRHSRCRLDGVIFGSDDYCADLGISRTNESKELLYARQKIVTVAKAYGLQPLDMVYIDYQDPEGLQRQAVEGYQMGFVGKQVIHPSQIPIVQEAFQPSKERADWARDLLDAYEANKKGVFVFRGQMVDMPTLLQAQNINNLIRFIEDQQ